MVKRQKGIEVKDGVYFGILLGEETWQSGRMHRFRKAAYPKGYRGFESSRFRSIIGYMKKEVEVKVKIDNADDLIVHLEKEGFSFGDVVEQVDTIFAKPEIVSNYKDFKHGDVVLRVRETPRESFFTLKQTQSNELDCVEKETVIEKPEEMKEAIFLMGYVQVTIVKKKRRVAKKGDYEICVDQVEKLGDFVEIEVITDNSDSDAVQKELMNFLVTFGVSGDDRVYQGYDTLLVEQEKTPL